MSTTIIGFKPPDKKWKEMKAIYDACVKADIEVPDKVVKFFEYEPPDDKGVQVELPAKEWSDEASEGFELEVDKIPKDVKILRFYNSW